MVLLETHPENVTLAIGDTLFISMSCLGERLRLNAMGEDARTCTKAISTIQEVLKLEEYRESSQNTFAPLATGRDALTQLRDRGTMDSELPQILAEATDSNRPLSLVMVDIDHFKKVNDSHGHPKGDAVLAETAAQIISIVEGKGRAYRYGGEEMVILLPNHNTQEAIAVAERVRQTLEGAHPGSLAITASFGVSTFPDHGRTSAEMISAADDALYDAKNRGRNLVRVFGEPPPAQPDKAREPDRKPPTPGRLTEEERERFRLLHFQGNALICPRDRTLLRVVESEAIGQPIRLLIHCRMCGWSDEC
jgi:diguanylate cyclase (GGDEF)-like protein